MEFNEKQFEKIFFKGLLTDNSVFSAVNEYLTPEIFEVKSFQPVIKFYKKFFKKRGRIPSTEELKMYLKDNAFFNSVKDAFSKVKDIDFKEIDDKLFYENCEVFLKERIAMLALNNIVDELGSKGIDASKVVKKFESVAGISLNQDIGFDIFKDVDKYIEDAKKPDKRLPTGFNSIDKHIGGGLLADGKMIGVVCAETNMGKSIMLGNLATNCVRAGKKVLLITLEMSEMLYASRIYSALYDININQINLRADELKEYTAKDGQGSMIIKEFAPGTMTVAQIKSYIEKLYKMGKTFDLVCVDYLTLMKAVDAENSNDAGEEITRGLRALSYDFKIPFFTAAQLNRDAFSNKPDMSNMARSIAICAEADFIISLHREEGDDELSIMRLSFLKSRLGPKGFTIKMYYNTECLRFEDMNENAEALNPEQTQIMNAFNFLESNK